jgi:hypothetical protein
MAAMTRVPGVVFNVSIAFTSIALAAGDLPPNNLSAFGCNWKHHNNGDRASQ